MKPGIESLLKNQRRRLTGRRIALVSHSAALDRTGAATAQLLFDRPECKLVCIMGPEHGYYSRQAAGDKCADSRHPFWKIPVYSLYGATRKPTGRMLRGVDLIIIDLQDLGVRCYTYLATMYNVMQAAAECGIPVIVADRPVPLPDCVDGPLPAPDFSSFVCPLPLPLVYGMTPGESARWIVGNTGLNLELHVAPLMPETSKNALTDNQTRSAAAGKCPSPWSPPSPAIHSWDCARCYPATVSFEALPHIDHGRNSAAAFQVFGAAWLHGRKIAAALQERRLAGVAFHSHIFNSAAAARPVDGVRITVTDRRRYRPALTALHILHAIMHEHGNRRVWNNQSARGDFFDKLWGGPAVREALLDGTAPEEIAAGWRKGIAKFKITRRNCLLYGN